MPTFDVTTIGEGGLRLSVPNGRRLAAADAFDVHVIGAEFNVTSSLSHLGWNCAWASAVHQSAIGDRVMRAAHTNNLDTSLVHRSTDGRTGVYYVEYSQGPRPVEVLFDRARTSFSQLTPDQIDLARLVDTRLVHLSGLSVAVGTGPRACIEAAKDAARAAGAAVSFDVNYRSTMWAPEAAANALRPLVEGVDVLLCSERDAELLFEATGPRSERIQRLRDATSATSVFMSIGSDGLLALVDDRITECPSMAPVVVDRLGAGDGMAAGVLHAWLQSRPDLAPNYGAVMAALALSQHGEQVLTSAEELDRLAADPTIQLRR